VKLETGSMGRQELHELIGIGLSPLPIAFISTISPDGIYNAAPFSFAAPICSKPPVICVSIGLMMGKRKDTIRNIESSHDFVVNTVDEEIFKQVIQTSAGYPYEVDEINQTGLTAVPSEKVKSPRIGEAKISLECRLLQKIQLMEEYKDGPGLRDVVFGEIVTIHIKDDVLTDGKVDPLKLNLISRIGSELYCKPGEIFEMKPVQI
jgi:flavin reductase (DIM6/NTAB) family NADH-FMN oxidoreductase RutF